MLTKAKKVQMVLRVDPKVREVLRRMAAHDGRSLSGQLTHLVREEAQRQRAPKQAAA